MKRKRTDWTRVPWTAFTAVPVPAEAGIGAIRPAAIFVNSRYQVSLFTDREDGMFGPMVHLSIKTHDKAAHHDWRDFQRIKNELCGAECEAVELYPAESRLVDGANQYHLFVFRDFRFPFGFRERLVSDGTWRTSQQRPFEPGTRPADCLDAGQFEAVYQKHVNDAAESEEP